MCFKGFFVGFNPDLVAFDIGDGAGCADVSASDEEDGVSGFECEMVFDGLCGNLEEEAVADGVIFVVCEDGSAAGEAELDFAAFDGLFADYLADFFGKLVFWYVGEGEFAFFVEAAAEGDIWLYMDDVHESDTGVPVFGGFAVDSDCFVVDDALCFSGDACDAELFEECADWDGAFEGVCSWVWSCGEDVFFSQDAPAFWCAVCFEMRHCFFTCSILRLSACSS